MELSGKLQNNLHNKPIFHPFVLSFLTISMIIMNPKKKLQIPSPIHLLKDEVLSTHQVQLWLKRDDLIHPAISGNKWRKLKYNLQALKAQQQTQLLTFGGAYSNHITATAALGKYEGIKTIGIIRGEQPDAKKRSPALQFALDCGMHLHFVSRSDYRTRMQPDFLATLQTTYGRFYLVPDGGSNALAVKGCQEIVAEINHYETSQQAQNAPPFSYHYICCACGTSATFAGIVAALVPSKKAIGFPVLKGGVFLQKDIKNFLLPYPNANSSWQLQCNYHFGGYAKTKPALLEFIRWFQQQHQVALDYVYTGKLLFGIYDLIKQGFFPPHSHIVAVHTGGVANAGVSGEDI